MTVFQLDGAPVDPRLLTRMRDAMTHRGPDDCGSWIDGAVGLAHRRLSIVDVADGHQPMSDETGRVWIVFNGEIYNHEEIRKDLSARGYHFRTRCDTEAILALYAMDGATAFSRLNGIFAFSIWDARERVMLLVRDRVGVKPMYVFRSGTLVAAASEIKALLEHPQIKREVDEDAIPEYLAFRQLAGRRTLFRGIETLAPGEILEISESGTRSHRYWELPEIGRAPARTLEECTEELGELLGEATHMQLMSDVPLGTFNSGGVDSSLITTWVAEQVGSGLNTFCIGLEDPSFDERSYASLVAKQYGTHHREILMDSDSFADHLPRMIWHHDEPLTHPNTVPLYLLSKLAKESVTVVLTGEGCDEFFGGYPRYRIGKALDLLRGASGPVGWLTSPWAVSTGGPTGKLLAALRQGPEEAVVQATRYVPSTELEPLLSGDCEAIAAARRETHGSSGDAVSMLLAQDQRNYLMPILNRLDRATMAASVEARVPFLDHRVLEFAARVPTRHKVRWRDSKLVVKRLAETRLPREIVYRRKSGLAMPLADWFRSGSGLGALADVLLEPRSLQRGYLRPERLRQTVERHRSGAADHSELIWGLLNLELWQREMIETA